MPSYTSFRYVIPWISKAYTANSILDWTARIPGRGLRRGGIMSCGLQVEKWAVQFNQCGRQQSVFATSGPYVIHFLLFLRTTSLHCNTIVFLVIYSGNYMGDPGARLLSKALQINTSLRALSIDRNSITVHGYSDIAYALERYAYNPIRFPTRYRLDTHSNYFFLSVCFCWLIFFTYVCVCLLVTEH